MNLFATRNLKFLVTFKKGVYANSKKVKVKDFENKEKDEPREGLVEKIKSRLKYHYQSMMWEKSKKKAYCLVKHGKVLDKDFN